MRSQTFLCNIFVLKAEDAHRRGVGSDLRGKSWVPGPSPARGSHRYGAQLCAPAYASPHNLREAHMSEGPSLSLRAHRGAWGGVLARSPSSCVIQDKFLNLSEPDFIFWILMLLCKVIARLRAPGTKHLEFFFPVGLGRGGRLSDRLSQARACWHLRWDHSVVGLVPCTVVPYPLGSAAPPSYDNQICLQIFTNVKGTLGTKSTLFENPGVIIAIFS